MFDTESDDLALRATKVWCAAYNWYGESDEVHFLDPSEVHTFSDVLSCADEVVAHNLLGHDLVVLLKCGIIQSFSVGPDMLNGRPCKFTDTLVLSRNLNADREGGHSLENFGELTGVAKQQHSEWHQYSEDMKTRCTSDVKINCNAYRLLKGELNGKEMAR